MHDLALAYFNFFFLALNVIKQLSQVLSFRLPIFVFNLQI